jgi:hypothetical protein
VTEHQRLAAENLYRDANTLIYGDNKPSEDAIDRVVSKINREWVPFKSFCFRSRAHSNFYCSVDKKGKFSRKRLNEDEGDITYINERNRVFNRKANPRHSSVDAHANPRFLHRLRGIMTSIRRRFGQVSSAARLCNFHYSCTVLATYR